MSIQSFSHRGLASEQKRQLLAQLLERKASQLALVPLSTVQERLWFFEQLQEQSSTYNICSGARLQGKLNIELLEHCLDKVMQRHEALRTTFILDDGLPVQRVGAVPRVQLVLKTLLQLPEEQREREARKLAVEEARHPFDLAHGPLLRVLLLRLANEEHLLVLNIHHIIADGWSCEIILRELSALYTSYAKGGEISLPLPAVQYRDFVQWQQKCGPVWSDHLKYWQQHLNGVQPLQLPLSQARPPAATYRGGRQWKSASAETLTTLKTLSQQAGATLYMTLLSAFNILLARYSGTEDIVVGTPSAGRSRQEFENVVGCFINLLALRTDLSGQPSFVEVLRRTRQVVLDAYAHQDVPMEKVVEAVLNERDITRNPLVQVQFAHHHVTMQQLHMADLKIQPYQLHNGTTKFELSLLTWEEDDKLVLSIEYNADLFSDAMIGSMLDHLHTLLENIALDPTQPWVTLPLLTPQEEQQITEDWNTPSRDFGQSAPEHTSGGAWSAVDDPQPRCLHELFEAQARLHPHTTAVLFEGSSLTYGQLDQRANALASRLQTLGVGVETPVAICLDRSLELVISILGVLKAGGMYIPLDPEYPRERQTFMLQDARARIVLSSRSLAATLPQSEAYVCYLDDLDLARQAGVSTAQPVRSSVTPENIAYIIYTSGSTGKPKGAMIPHRALANHMRWMQETFQFSKHDRVLQKTSFSFDASIWEFYAPLLAGACLVIARPGGHLDPAYLIKTIVQQQITILQLVPSMLRALLDESDIGTCQSLTSVFCGGEDLTVDLQERFFAALPAQLYNLYGPTECTIDNTCWACERVHSRQRVPLGHPILNTQVYVLDRYLQPVPIGVTGELYVAGEGLGRGYYRRPELTAEKFLPNPFSHKPGSLLYRSGDLGRYGADGVLEFLGRGDYQVKLRGYRIELGEIESALSQHAAVRECVVVVQSTGGEDKILVAYVAGLLTQDQATGQFSAYLRSVLPVYMIPSAFVVMESLPLTSNGKIDRRALPAVLGLEPEAAPASGKTTTPVQEVLLGIWQRLLQHGELDIHDDFFVSGGHSLLASRLVAQVRKVFKIELAVRSLFEAPTIAQLAQKVESALRQNQSLQAEAPLLPGERSQEIPLALAQQRLWFLEQLETRQPLYNVPLAVRLIGKLDPLALQTSLQDLIQRHETLRTTFGDGVHGPIQRIHAQLPPRLAWHDVRHLFREAQAGEVTRLFYQEQQARFDLQNGPLLRVHVLHVAEEEHVLLLTQHHILTDAWSMQVLLQEWGACYAARCQGEIAQLAPLPLQYADYALWQQTWLASERMQEQETYWREQLRDLPDALELPTDRPRGSVVSHHGANERFTLGQELVSSLRKLSQQEGNTLYMTLLAAYQLLLSKYTRQEDIIVGTPSGQRVREELQGMIGFLVNTLPIRTRLEKNLSVQELLSRVRQAALEAYTHQELPFERVVDLVSAERDLSHTPVFQVVFVYEQMAIQEGAFADLVLSPIDVPTTVAKFELTLILRETKQGIEGAFFYNRDLFDAETIRRMCGHYQQVIAELLKDLHRPLGAVTLLTSDEQARITRWNETRDVYPTQRSVPQLITRQATHQPGALAIEGPEPQQSLTYQELEQRANQLAHYLQRQGIGAESLVCLCLERSIDLVIAELAILKAGAAYVPLDPTHPISRLAYMLQDTRPAVLLTQQHLLEIVAAASKDCGVREVICLDNQSALCWQEETGELMPTIELEQLAYVIYTSGSTGQPKGVQVSHRGLLNLIDWYQRTFQVTAQDRSSHLASVGFDGTVWEIWPILSAGATLVLPEEYTKISADLLQRWYVEQRITLSFAPTPLAEQLLLLPWPAETSLRYLHTAGDQLSSFPSPNLPFVLVNNYGPTENTVEATHEYVPTSDRIEDEQRPAIGRPIANVEAYILDTSLQPVPVGVPGELYLGGVALARGYLNRPDLTAERFIPHAFSDVPGERLYKTGDFCSYLSDGRLHFIGRNDRQVKIRGFRIELGEVEALFQQEPGVSQVAVVAFTNAQGQKQLAAYLAPEPGQVLTLEALRASLRMKVPEYMVPASFTILEKLPLTSSGKLNRRDLPAPHQVTSLEASAYVAPQTSVELTIAEIWQQVLQCEHVGIQENFFDLGGHSLRMAQVHRRLQAVFQRDIPLIDLFQYPTIQALAVYLQQVDAELALPKRERQIQGAKQRLRSVRQRQQQRRDV